MSERSKGVAPDRSKSWVIEQAARDFVAAYEWQVAAIREGVEDADAGRVVAHGEVASWVSSWGTANKEREPPDVLS